MARYATVLLLVLLALPATASAGVARMDSEALEYNAYAGEVNDVTVEAESETTLLVTDATGQVDVGERCFELSDHQARCTARPGRVLLRFRHVVYLQDGNDKARGPVNIRGGDGDDEIVDETPADWTPGSFFGFTDTTGDAGNDTIVGQGQGNEGNDVLRALPGRDSLLLGGVGDDRLEGSTANDLLMPGPGSDHVVSGGGRDTLNFNESQNPDEFEPLPTVVFSLENGPQGGRAGEADTYDGTFVEVVVGSSPNSVVTGNELNNRLTGLGTLRGLAGDDELVSGAWRLRGNQETTKRLEGGEGDDYLDGGIGFGDRDEFDGGPGDDWIRAWDEADIEGDNPGRGVGPAEDAISCGPGKDRIDVDTGDPRPADCEIVALVERFRVTVNGTNGADVLDGLIQSDSRDFVYGRAGNDVIAGLSGPDVLYGQDGNDRILGESADPGQASGTEADTLSGGNGEDHLIGGFGNDRITGGAGSDRISGGVGNDVIGARDRRRDKVVCGSGRDTVTADRRDSVSGDCEVVRRR